MKKIISLILICCMVLPMIPASAAEEATSQPTIEEILNSYHEKALEARAAEENGGASTYSRSGGSEKTLEEETVDELTAAGYEAYNVTAENYDALEESLQTDFADMGLDTEGSYIVVISGEDPSGTNTTNPNARVDNLPEYDLLDPGGGTTSNFQYTYEGETYTMRYVIITAADNNQLGMTSYIDLLDEYDNNDMWEDLNLPITIVSSLPGFTLVGTVYSLFSVIPTVEVDQFSSFLYHGATNWTIKYIQVYDSDSGNWNPCSSAEYVTMTYFTNYTYYDSSTNKYKQDSAEGTFPILYSEYYNNSSELKRMAALSQANNGFWEDTIAEVNYVFDEETLITHQRPMV